MPGPEVIYRYNRYRAAQIIGQTRAGLQLRPGRRGDGGGRAAELPPGFGYEWTGTVFQQKLARRQGRLHLRLRGGAGVAVPRGAV